MTETDRSWHNSFKPHFGNDGKLLYRSSKPQSDTHWQEKAYTSSGTDTVGVGQEKINKVY